MTHNRYNCKHRGEVPGSIHSSCNAIATQNPIHIAMYMHQNQGQTENLKLNPNGMRNGWAFWSVDFDPCWVERCNFYEEKPNV